MDRPRHAARSHRAPAGAVPAWTRLVVASLARSLVVIAVSLAAWSAAPRLIGWEPTTVVSASMAPKIMVGDVVVARPVEPTQVKIGEVLLVQDPDRRGELRLHRLAEVDADGQFVLRGDANAQNDSSHVSPSALEGIAVVRVPWAGLPGLWLGEGRFERVAALAVVLLALLTLTGIDRDLRRPRRDDEDADGGSTSEGPAPVTVAEDDRDLVPAWLRVVTSVASSSAARAFEVVTAPVRRLLPHHGRHRAPAAGRRLVPAAVLAVLAVGVAVAVPSNAAVVATTVNTGNTLTMQPWLSCADAVKGVAGTPWAFYRFDEASGTNAADSSGNNRTGTYQTPSRVAYGATRACARDTGSAVTFSQGGLITTYGHVTSPAYGAGPDVYTVQSWFKTTGTLGGKLFGFGNSNIAGSTAFDRHVYMTNDGRLVGGVKENGTQKAITSTASYNDGAWHLATLTQGNGGLRLYVDGAQVAVDTSVVRGEAYSGYWKFGYDSLGGWPNLPWNYGFGGTMDDAAVWQTALTDAQVKAVYDAGR